MPNIDQMPDTVVSHLHSYFEDHQDDVVPRGVGYFSIDKRELRVGDGLTAWKDIAPFIFREDLNIDSVAGQLQNRINELEDALTALQNAVNAADTSLAGRVTSLEGVDETHNTNISTINSSITTINKDISDLVKRLDELTASSGDSNSSILSDIAELRQTVSTLQSQLEGLQSSVTVMVQSMVVQDLDDPSESTALSTEALSAIIDSLSTQISSIRTTLSGVSARFDSNGVLLPAYGGTGVTSIAALKNLLGVGSGGVGSSNAFIGNGNNVVLPSGGTWNTIEAYFSSTGMPSSASIGVYTRSGGSTIASGRDYIHVGVFAIRVS